MERNSKETTTYNLKKLFRNPKFIAMYKEKGSKLENWCWQSRVRLENSNSQENENYDEIDKNI